ncbi:MAG: hypothetical protein M0P64_00695 [Candidatus Pacebacteria bacterium]|jgi:hypothetical protein|nr:hypothetical protein [Candidatus Paceibacterota bacterium]
MTNFFFSYFNIIVLAVWIIFFTVVALRVLRPELLKKISYRCLITSAISIHLLYGVFATWLQYIAFSGSSVGQVLVNIALPKEVPFAWFVEWTRPMFEGAHGYFAFYAFQHFFLITVALLALVGLVTLFFSVYAKYRPALFEEGDIAIIALAFLISGWYGSLVLIPLAGVFAALYVIIRIVLKKSNKVNLPVALLLTVPVAFVFAIPILSLLSLYPLLKL